MLTLLRRRGGGSPVTVMLRAMTTQHVDFVGIGDSNQLLSGYGWDHGWQYALSLLYPMYASGLISANENAGAGSGSGYKYNYLNGNDIGAITGAPAQLEAFWKSIGHNNYGYLDDAGTFGSSNTGLALAADCPLDVNAALTFRFHYGTFPSGTGSMYPCVRRGSSPFTALNAQMLNQVTGSYGMTSQDITLPAAARSYPLEGNWQFVSTVMQGPAFLTFVHAMNTQRSAGFSYSTLLGLGGYSLRGMLDVLQTMTDSAVTHYFGIIRARQAQTDKKIVIPIHSGMNDRNETNPSLGPNPVADGDSPEAYADNLHGICNRLEAIWTLNAWPLTELTFLFDPSFPTSTPDDAELISYRAAARTVASSRVRCQVVDEAELVTHAQLLAGGEYASAGVDTVHRSQLGYENGGVRKLNALLTA